MITNRRAFEELSVAEVAADTAEGKFAPELGYHCRLYSSIEISARRLWLRRRKLGVAR